MAEINKLVIISGKNWRETTSLLIEKHVDVSLLLPSSEEGRYMLHTSSSREKVQAACNELGFTLIGPEG